MGNLSDPELRLYRLLDDRTVPAPIMDQLGILYQEVQFLEIYRWCSDLWHAALPGEKNKHMGFVTKFEVEFAWEAAMDVICDTADEALRSGNFEDWDCLASEFPEIFQHCKSMIREDCLHWLESSDCSLQCKFFDLELLEFALRTVVHLKDDKMTVDVKMQIGGILELIEFFEDVIFFSVTDSDLKDFKFFIQTWSLNAACLSLLNWVLNEKEDEMAPRMNKYFSDLHQKLKPSTPGDMKIYLAAFKCSQKSELIHAKMDNVVSKFVDLILDNFHLILLMDGTQNLHSELVFFMKFLADPLLAACTEDAKSIADNVERHIYSLLLAANRFIGCSAEEGRIRLPDFLREINIIKAEVRRFYSHILLDSSSFNFPSTNLFGFIDLFLDNLKEISVHFENHQIVNVWEEILSLRPLLKHILELQNEHKELKGLWTRIINVVYRAEIFVNLFVDMSDSVWYDIDHLSGVIDEIKLIKSEVKKIQDQHMYSISLPIAELDSSLILPLRTNASRTYEVFVGHKDATEIIVNQLIRGKMQRDIVSIVGMAGLGKTTLAKRVYSDPRVRHYFHKFAWCCISQTYETKGLLLEILSDLNGPDDNLLKEEKAELAQRLYKCLKGQRYLIVMDDIWDIGAWDTLKESFPDDNNGSRIIFTSRIHNVANSDCSPPHALGPLSDEESWELLQKKLFGDNFCPPKFSECGQEIARNCNGLPLAAVVIAGLLSKEVENLVWWTQIAETLGSQFATEVCKDVLELSYKHLPEFLKPCFLYFCAFPEDKVVRVKRLIQLWISEGFIQKPKGKNLENVAKEYLMDLVDRSLVIVSNRSSNGEIKTCHVHDLLHEFCLAKAKEENFLLVNYGCFPNSGGANLKPYRMCFQIQGPNSGSPCVHSLLFFPRYHSISFVEPLCYSNFGTLRVLDLKDTRVRDNFPEEITTLVLLRYLTIRFLFEGSIPTSISKLKNLETFCIVRFAISEISLPDTFWTMIRLRHVEVGILHCASSSGDFEREESSGLDNIQTFSCPSLSYGEDAISILRRISRVRRLRCRFDDSWDPHKGCNQFPVLDVLNQLESLNVEYIGKGLCPCALNFPSTLKKLTLKYFKLPWNEISVIGKLANLEVLKLLEDSFQGEKWDMEDEDFSSLKFLKLSKLDIAHWNASDSSFPCLQQLIVEDCRNLEVIPCRFGENLTLEVIRVRNCRSTVTTSVWQIQEEQLGMGKKDLQVLVTNVTNDDIV